MDLLFPLPVRIFLAGLARDLDWLPISQDLIEVACAIMLADRLTLRPRNTLGSRKIKLELPVRQPQIWRRAVPALQNVLSILCDDIFTFDIYKTTEGAKCISPWNSYIRKKSLVFQRNDKFNNDISIMEPLENRETVECVVLFSGGLDSAAAAATFARSRVNAAYVTHYVNGIHRINRLLMKIYEKYGAELRESHAQFCIRPFGPLVQYMRERSRRSRPFLFISLALVTATGLGAHKVFVCENGVLALNLPLNAAMVPTRHAHSRFLFAMERFAEALFGETIKISNPFELKTKGEMSRILSNHPEMALETISCWNQQWSGRGKNYGKGHCGYCVPCLIRLVSLEAAGINIPQSHFDIDIRHLAKRSRLSAREIGYLGLYKDLLGFVARIKSCRSWKEFLSIYPEVIAAEPTSHILSPEEWYRALFAMMKRFALEVDCVLDGK